MACWLFFACSVLMCVFLTNELTVSAAPPPPHTHIHTHTSFHSLATVSLLKSLAKDTVVFDI